MADFLKLETEDRVAQAILHTWCYDGDSAEGEYSLYSGIQLIFGNGSYVDILSPTIHNYAHNGEDESEEFVLKIDNKDLLEQAVSEKILSFKYDG